MDLNALFKISYGLFVVGVESKGKRNGCIINTASQATAEPPGLVVTMLKTNLTAEMIREKGSFAVSVLSIDCPMKVFEHFGYRSGRQQPKFVEESEYRSDMNGNPYLPGACNALISLTVRQTADLGTHWLFICSVDDAKTLSETESMTYADYRILKAGGALGKTGGDAKPAEKKYVCSVCHYIYDGEIPFEDLPDDYVCPICGVGKELFVLE